LLVEQSGLCYIKHPELRESVRSAARNTVESNFNIKVEVDKLEQLIREQVQS